MGRARKRKTPAAVAPPEVAAAVLPVPGRRSTWLGAAIVFLAALAAYGLTLAPTVTLVDSGELIVAARNLGVAHPPGFPLYVLLAHGATRVPVGTVAQRVNALSALCAALAAAALTWVTRQALVGRGAPASAPTGSTPAGILLTPSLVAGLLLAFSRNVWAYATVAEVYTLATLAVVGLLGLALRSRSAASVAALGGLAAAYGLATGTHHVTIALVGPALLALAWAPLRARATPARVALFAVLGFGSAALAYLYLPWAAARDVFPNWGDPRTLQRVWWHVSGRQYQAYLTPTADSIGQEALAFAQALLRAFGPAWFPPALVLAAVGLRAAWRSARPLAIALLLLVGFDLAYALLYTIAEDKDAYYLPAVVALCLAAGLGAHEVLSRFERRQAAWAGLLLAVPLVGAGLLARTADRSRFFVAHDFARDALASVGPGGLLVTAEWQLYSPLLYLQEVEGWRADVMAVDVSLLRRSWYIDALRRRYPDRWATLRAQTDAFLEDLRAWEEDPRLFEADGARTQRINERFQALVVAVCAADAARGLAYATSDVVLPQSPDPPLADRLARTFPLTPRGIVFSLKAPLDPEPAPDLRPRGLFDGTLALSEGDVALVKVRPVYLSMAVNRGRFLELRGDPSGAEASYRQALAWDPSYQPAREALTRLSRGR